MIDLWLEIGDRIGGRWVDLATVIALVATAVGAWLTTRTGVKQGHFVFSGMINATEEALYTEYIAERDLDRVRSTLRIDNFFAIAFGALFVLMAIHAGGDIAERSVWRDWAGIAAWAAVAAAIADVLENTLFLSVLKTFERSMDEDEVGKVSWIKANLAMTFGTLKMSLLIGFGVVLAVVTTAEHPFMWKALAIVVAVVLIFITIVNFRSAHKHWKVHA